MNVNGQLKDGIASTNLDSLLQVSNRYTREDQGKIRLLNAISSLCEVRNPSKGVDFANEAIQLAQKFNSDNREVQLLLAEAFNSKALNHFAKGEYQIAKELFDKALDLNLKYKNKFGVAYNQINISRVLNLKGDPNKAIELSESALKIFNELNDKIGIAKTFNNYGNIYLGKNQFDLSLKYFQQAASIFEQEKNLSGIANCFGNIGVVYNNLSNFPKALEYYQLALSINERLGNDKSRASNLGNIGSIYTALADHSKALEYHKQALLINDKLGFKDRSLVNLINIASNSKSQNKNIESLESYLKALAICEELDNKKLLSACLINIGSLYSGLSDSECKKFGLKPNENYLKAINYSQKAIEISEQIGNKKNIASSLILIGRVYFVASDSLLNKLGINPNDRYVKSLEYYDKAFQISKEIGDIENQKSYWQTLSLIYKMKDDYKNAYSTYLKFIELRDSIEGSAVRTKINSKELQFSFAKKEDSLRYIQQLTNEQLEKQKLVALQQQQQIKLKESELALANKDKEIQYLAFLKEQAEKQNLAKQKKIEAEFKAQEINILQKQKELANIKASRSLGFSIGLGSALIGILFVTYAFFIQNKRKAKLNAELQKEKSKSDSLLLNILPEEVANELKETGKAEAKLYPNVSVMFTDFVGFTTVAAELSPTELVREINKNFTAFDAIIEKHGLEKIKTIGDAYLAVCGLPIISDDHAVKMIQAAIEIRDYMISQTNPLFQIRIGVHSGPVIAGIVGVKKYAYDIWGDTVNTAARMEQNSESGKINVSGVTYALTKDKFNFEFRGKIAAKNKGEIEMYFIS